MPRTPLADESVSALPWACRGLLGSARVAKLFHWNLLEPAVVVVVTRMVAVLVLIAPGVRMHLTSALPLSTTFGATVPMLPVTPMAYLDAIFADMVRASFRVALLNPLENAFAMPITRPMQGTCSTATCSRAVRRVPV